MRIEIQRKLDYWLGIPICFALSVYNFFKRIFVEQKNKSFNPKKILFIEFSEIGSAILAYSAIKKVSDLYPDAKIYFWIFKRNQEVLRILGIVPSENIISLRDDNFLLLIVDIAKNLRRIYREKIDTCIDMELFSRFSSILSYLSKAKMRIGFDKLYLEGLYRGSLRTHRVQYNPYMHISKNFLALVLAIDKNSKEIPLLKAPLLNYETVVPKVNSDKEAIEKIWHKLKQINPHIKESVKIVILNPGFNEALPLRRWPIENYIDLANKLMNDKEVFVILIGIGPHMGAEKMIKGLAINSQLINLVGKTDIRELIDLYNISCLLISHDSGAVNLASLSAINIIVLFGPETPVLYAPLNPNKAILYKKYYCSPCLSAYNHRRSECIDNKCMQSILIDDVYTEAKKYLYNPI